MFTTLIVKTHVAAVCYENVKRFNWVIFQAKRDRLSQKELQNLY